MRKILLIVLVLISFGAFAQSKDVKDADLEKQAANIRKELSLDDKTEHLVYNTLYHVKMRIADIPLGHGNYKTLISYIDEERVSMMKSLLSITKYEQYENIFGTREKQKIINAIAKNDEYIKNNGILVKKMSLIDMDDKFTQEEDDESEESEEKEKNTDSIANPETKE
ncbi:MAG: hypothetical protein LBS55_08975 [Prevotellaceae bacterium]|jgi:hypothetical protein|nr:hypothetical protein [Prevotellaceae bacterium]